jgi:hypothetical protein
MSDLVHDERVKVAATFCNNLAVVCFATLAITPFGVQVFHLTQPPTMMPMWEYRSC